MLATARQMLEAIDVPISKSICPNVKLKNCTSFFGRCCHKNSKQNDSDYDHLIQISSFTLGNTEKSLMNTMLHECLHTIEGSRKHDETWKHWAGIVNRHYGYDIKRQGGDKTQEDFDNLNNGKPKVYRRVSMAEYTVWCPECGTKWRRKVKSKLIKNPEKYRCGDCGEVLERYWY